ncbi:UNVERIFIED_CONTAM: hypothetical protein FKN15_034340 [Acipenser sinensis]
MKIPVVTKWQSWKLSKSKSMKKLGEDVKEASHYLKLWRKALLKIGGPAECLHYNPSPQGLVYFYSYLLDLLSGTGFMELSSLFYGFYQNSEVGVSSQFSYNVPLAYLLTCLFYILLSLTWIVLRSGSGFKLAVVTGDGDLSSYSMSVFCGWDFGLEGEQAARLKQNSIRYELQEDPSVKDNFFLLLLVQYLPSIVITAANFLVPTLCDIIIRFERYSMTMQIKLTLISLTDSICPSLPLSPPSSQLTLFQNCRPASRTFRSSTSNFFFLLVLLLGLGLACVPLGYSVAVIHPSFGCGPFRSLSHMWDVVPQSLTSLPKTAQSFFNFLGSQAFAVPLFLLSCLVFSYMAAMASVYGNNVAQLKAQLKLLTLFQNCRPASRTFRSSTSNFFFLLVLLLGLGLACVPLGYSVAVIHPSFGCGPFRSLSHMWDVVPQSLTSLPKTAQSFFNFLGSQAFAVPLFLLSCLVFSYMAAMASVYGNNVAQLKAQLKLFLVKRISELTPANQKKSAGPSGSVVDISETRELWE